MMGAQDGAPRNDEPFTLVRLRTMQEILRASLDASRAVTRTLLADGRRRDRPRHGAGRARTTVRPVRYRADLRELNELNFARFDTKLEQRLAESDARWGRRIGRLENRLIRWMFASGRSLRSL